MNEYNTLLMSALLHDIGKFWQGTNTSHDSKYSTLSKNDFGYAGAHGKWSASFIKYLPKELQSIENLLLYHHKPESIQDPNTYKIAKILQVADWYSSGEREPKEGIEARRDTPLISIFSRVDIGRGEDKLPLYYYKLKELDISEGIFPSSETSANLQVHYRKLWNGFIKEIKTLNYKDFTQYYISLLYVLQKYTWCVPSAVFKHMSDVSLYDHLKTTSAIASCLYKYHECTMDWRPKAIEDKEPKKFLLIGGDLSGIQNYIYNIASVGVGGVAKRLRARSFYIGALVDSIMYALLHKLELPISCNVISSGGNFYILAPNTPEILQKIKEFKKDTVDWLLKQFHGDVYINIAFDEFAGDDFGLNKFPKVLDSVNDALDLKKIRKFDEILLDDAENKWKDRFLEDCTFKGKVCKSCNRMPATEKVEDTDLCNLCSLDEKVGRWLLNTNYIAFTSEKSENKKYLQFFSINPYYVYLLEKLDDHPYDLILEINKVKV
ncbi:MAG: type III-A CRISPR-associated protein Cas10/Csm1, partial [Methanosarcinales archaeon]